MKRSVTVFLFFILACAWTLLPGSVAAQERPCKPASTGKDLSDLKWKAHWIAHPDVPGQAYSVQHFRCTIHLKEVVGDWTVHVSADPRCQLFVNGQPVWSGPARSDLAHWPFATLDLAPHLLKGKNIVGATVWNHGEYNPWSQISERTGFILYGEGAAKAISTGPGWKVFADPSYSIADTRRYPGIPALRPVRFDTRTHPWGWQDPAFDDSEWATPALVSRGAMRGVSDAGSPWWLTPQTVPDLERVPQRFAAIRRSTGLAPASGFLAGSASWTIPAQSKASILLDQEVLTTAYPLISTDGGRDAEIRMKWAEAMVDIDGRKGHRDEVEGRSISTPADVFVLDGGLGRVLTTHAFRIWRYLELEIETKDEPLVIRDLSSLFTAHPRRSRTDSVHILFPLLCDPRDGRLGSGRPLPGRTRTLARHARVGTHHLRREAGAYPLRLSRLECLPKL